MSAWIEMISDEDAGPELAEMLDLARTPHGTVDNVMRVHSLRPNTMKGHVTLYRAALHDDTNTIPMWLQENHQQLCINFKRLPLFSCQSLEKRGTFDW